MTAGSAIIAGAFMLSISTSSFIGYVIDLYRYLSIRGRGVKIRGLVRELIYDDEENLACRLLVEFNASDGKTYQIESSMGNVFWSKYKDKHIDIIYLKDDPKIAYIHKELKFRFGLFFAATSIWTLTGLFFLLYGLYRWIFT